jgi:hypothetical protein
VRGEIRGISNVSAIASMKSNLSISHLTSAKHFAALCAEIEVTYPTTKGEGPSLSLLISYIDQLSLKPK